MTWMTTFLAPTGVVHGLGPSWWPAPGHSCVGTMMYFAELRPGLEFVVVPALSFSLGRDYGRANGGSSSTTAQRRHRVAVSVSANGQLPASPSTSLPQAVEVARVAASSTATACTVKGWSRPLSAHETYDADITKVIPSLRPVNSPEGVVARCKLATDALRRTREGSRW